MITATLIVRDAGPTIRRCITSIREHVDHIIIIDTGSTDRTLRILEHLAADDTATPITVEQRDWEDSYSTARNQALDLIPPDTEWVWWMDADDVIDRGGHHLRRLTRWAAPDVIAFVIPYSYGTRGFQQDVQRLRLLRRTARWTWDGRVHERLTKPADIAGIVPVIRPDFIRVRHLAGQPSRLLDHHRLHEHRRLLLLDLDDNNTISEPWTLYALGMTAMDLCDEHDARHWFEQVLAHPHSDADITATATDALARMNELITAGRDYRASLA